MIDFAFMLVTYRDDFYRAKNLINSFNFYNAENLKLFVVTVQEDLKMFKVFENNQISVIDRSLIPINFVGEHMVNLPMRSGYINQEIVKLSFWELRLCNNYLCLDSDGEFIRKFYKKDFMFNFEEPYIVAVDDLDLKADPEYFDKHWVGRELSIRKIYEALNLQQPRNIKTCHGFQIFSCKYLEEFKQKFMNANELTYLDIILISPYEFSWYTIYVQSLDINLHYSEPFFKYFHTSNQYLYSKLLGVDRNDWAKSYVGIVVNSNFQPKNKQIDASDSLMKVIGYYVKTPIIIFSVFYKLPFLLNRAKHFIKYVVKWSRTVYK